MKDKPKIIIGTAMYKRPILTNVVFDYYKDMIVRMSNVVDICFISCGSEGDTSKNLTEKNGFEYIEHPNTPLSQKNNALFNGLKNKGFDFFIFIGSDDLINDNIILKYIEYYEKGYDYGGLLDFKFVSPNGSFYWPGYSSHRKGEPIGGGRFFSKKLLTKLNWNPWGGSEINYGLDGVLTNSVERHNINKFTLIGRGVGCDLLTIRGGLSITNMNRLPNLIRITNPLDNIVMDVNKVSKMLEGGEYNNVFKND
mgnify:CR=1 FL=1|tara:strand:+ start:316 stop:1074 length:759 start_codon:yes stop_codon:yes gene_type:complete